MKHKLLIAAIFLTLTLTWALGHSNITVAQDQRTLETRVVDILTEMPAQDEGHFIKLMEEMVKLDESGFLQLTDMLQPPGKEDDSRVRYALNGLAKYVTQPGKEEERKSFTSSTIKGLERITDKSIQSFLIRQLQIAGTNDAVTILGNYVNDNTLCEPVTQALLAIKSPDAEVVLLNALKRSTGPNQITIIKALGELHSDAALKKITKIIKTDNNKLRKVCLYALANIGSLNSEKILFDAAKETEFEYDPTGATQSYMSFIMRMGEKGKIEAMERMSFYLIENAPSNIRSQALSILINFKSELGTPLLADALDNRNANYRATALQLTNSVRGEEMTQIMLDKLDDVSPSVKVEIINALGTRGNEVAIPSILGYLDHQDPSVRGSAIKAAVLIADEQAIIPLLEVMSKGNPEDINTIKEAFFTIDNEPLVSEIYKVLDTMPATGKAALFDVLARRDPDHFVNIAREETKNSEKEIRMAAYSALIHLANAEDAKLIYKLFISHDDPDELEGIQKVILSLAKRLKDPEQVAFLNLFSDLDPGKKAYIHAILPELGGRNALGLLLHDYYNGNENLKFDAFDILCKWKDLDVLQYLYFIILEEDHDYLRGHAMETYFKMVTRSRIPAEQKVLLYRKLIETDPGKYFTKEVISNVGSLKIFQSLLLTGQYLDNPDLQQEAARAVIQLALPSEGREDGMTGTVVTELLSKAETVVSGEESQHLRQTVKDYLTRIQGEEGFISLFNGEDLTGWQGLVENPIARGNMDPEALKEAQTEANRKMHECWSANDNVIWFNGKGANLCSVKKYGDFELIVDWKITKGGDSGIYLRGTPQVQIWDTSRTNAGAQVGSGGLYNNQNNPSKPLVVADNPIGDWNTFRIIMIGERVSIWLNGQLVADNVILENYWDRNQPIFPIEQIELQAHGSNLGFRDIYIKEIPRINHNQLTEGEIQEGFVQLFNGKDLQNWTGNKTDYVVEDGTIVIYPDKGGHGNLYTEKEYADFNYRFEFQLTPGANNGLGIRTPMEGDPAYVGMELQILDNTAPIYRKLEQYQYHGSVYGVIPAKRGFLKPVGEWNSEEVIVNGSDIKIILNGTVIVDGNLEEASKNGTIDGNEHPGLKRTSGHIGFLGHGSVVKFRNIRIKKL